MSDNFKMLNAQREMFNEWTSNQCFNALNYFFIGNSLEIDHCKLLIVAPNGDA
jgi:hypothetical protein